MKMSEKTAIQPGGLSYRDERRVHDEDATAAEGGVPRSRVRQQDKREAKTRADEKGGSAGNFVAMQQQLQKAEQNLELISSSTSQCNSALLCVITLRS